MFGKRQNGIRFFFTSVVQKQLHSCPLYRIYRKVHAFPESRCTVNSVKSRSYVISVDLIKRYQVLPLVGNSFFSIQI